MNTTDQNNVELTILRDLLEAERFADHIYSQAFFELRNLPSAADALANARLAHLENVQTIESLIRQLGGAPSSSLEPRGAFANDPRAEIRGLDPSFIIAYLCDSERASQADYEQLLQRTDLSDETKSALMATLKTNSPPVLDALQSLAEEFGATILENREHQAGVETGFAPQKAAASS